MKWEATAMSHDQFKMKFKMHNQATDLIQIQTVGSKVDKPQRQEWH